MMTHYSSYLHTLYVLCVLCSCFVYNAVADDVCRPNGIQYADDADVKFALMLQLRNRDRDDTPKDCAMPSDGKGLQHYLAVEWLLEKINAYDNGIGYIPGIKMGYTTFDDCGESIYSARNSISFLNGSLPYLSASCQGHSQDVSNIAIIGPGSSSSALSISALIKDSQIPIISPMATMAELSNKDLHPTLFRTVPSDEQQMLLIVDMLEQLHWTYVAIAYQNDDYGRSGRSILVQKAKERGICVHKEDLVLSRDDYDFGNHFERMLRAAQGNSIAVVVIADSLHTGHLLFEVDIRVSGHKRGLHFILTTAVSTDSSVFKTMEQGQGTFSISTASELLEMQDVKTHINDRFERYRSQPAGLDNGHPLIKEYIETHGHPSNSFVPDSLDPLLPSTINAVMALVESFKSLHHEACGTQVGMCQDLSDKIRSGHLLDHLRAVKVDYGSIPKTLVPNALHDTGFSFNFNANGDINVGSSNHSLTIHSFDADTKSYKQVGYYTNGSRAHLDVTDVRWSSPSGDLLQGVPTSMCGVESCQSCRDSQDIPIMHMPGEVYIIGILSVHDPDPNDQFKCGKYRQISYDAIVAEGFLYAIKDLRAKTGIQFGAIGLDACYSQLRITSILTDLFSDKMTPIYSQLFPGESVKTLRDKVVGVIGCLSSDCTIPTARLMMPFNIPVVSYSASSPDLDDKIDFPIFLRTVPSDVYQAKAMVNIIRKMGWERVGLLYVNNNYGAKGMRAFRNIVDVEGSGICVPKEIPIMEAKTVDDVDLFEASRMLLSQGVKVVVFFGTDSRARDLIQNFEDFNRWGRFIFLGSEDWGTNEVVKNAGPNSALGTITLKLQKMGLESEEAFKEHLRNKETSLHDINVWHREFLQSENDCRFKGSFQNENVNRDCDPGLRLTESQVDQGVADQRTRHAMTAVYALGKGLDATRKKFCKSELKGCDFLKSNAPGVVREIKNQTRKDGCTQRLVFNRDGNGNIGYNVYNIQKVGTSYEYKIIGKCEPECSDLDGVRFYNNIGGEVPSLSAVCEKGQCAECQHKKVPPKSVKLEETKDNSMTDFRDSDILLISLVCVLIVVVAVAALAIFICYRKLCTKDVVQKNKVTEDMYEQIRQVYPSRFLFPTANLPVSDPDISPYYLCNRDGVANPTFLSDSADSVSQARGMNIDHHILYGSTTSGNITTNQYPIQSMAPTTPSSRPPEKYTASQKMMDRGNETDGSIKYVNDPPSGAQRQSSVVYSSLATGSLPLNAKNLQAAQNAMYNTEVGNRVMFEKDANGQLVAYVTSSALGQASWNTNQDNDTASQMAPSRNQPPLYGPYSRAAAIQSKKAEQIHDASQEHPQQNISNFADNLNPHPLNQAPQTPYENAEGQTFNFVRGNSNNYDTQIEQIQQQQQQIQQQLLLQQQQQQQQLNLNQATNQNVPLHYALPNHLLSTPSTFSTTIPASYRPHASTTQQRQKHSIQHQQSQPFSEPNSTIPQHQMIDPAFQQQLWMAKHSNQTAPADDQQPPLHQDQDQWQEGEGEDSHLESKVKGLHMYPESNNSLSSIPDVISGQMPQQPPTPMKSPREIELESIDLDTSSISDHEQEQLSNRQQKTNSGQQQMNSNVTSVV